MPMTSFFRPGFLKVHRPTSDDLRPHCSLVLVSSASSSTTRAAAAARPNILIVVTGDQRGGLDVMPKTIAWMGTAGTRYANAFASTPLCCPSRASILAGRYAHNHGVTSNRRAKTLDQQTTIQLPRSGGYRTASSANT